MDLDPTDRQLIGLLRNDGRASVTTLAATLSLSRATVQARLTRMIESGAIRKFTIELAAPDTDDLIRCVMFIELSGNAAKPVIARLRRMPQIASLHTTNGSWDFVAEIECSNLADFDQTLRAIREVPGVSNSESCLLLTRVG